MYKIPFVYPISGFWMEHGFFDRTRMIRIRHGSFDGTRMTRIKHGLIKGYVHVELRYFFKKIHVQSIQSVIKKNTSAAG